MRFLKFLELLLLLLELVAEDLELVVLGHHRGEATLEQLHLKQREGIEKGKE